MSSLPPRKEPLLPLESLPLPTITHKHSPSTKSPQLSTVSQPKSFCRSYWDDCVWPGLGLFGESYLLFSIGTLQPLWRLVFPTCFDTNEICRPWLLHTVSYAVVVGVITGMLVVGQTVQSRRTGSIGTATFMTFGAAGLTMTSFFPQGEGMVIALAVFLFIFGCGVGGEYPLAASSASEKAMCGDEQNKLQVIPEEQSLASKVQQHRGRNIQLTFSMQGMGIFCNSLVMTTLLAVYGQTTADKYNRAALIEIWRWTYLLGFLILLYVLISRIMYLEESAVWKQDKEMRERNLKPNVATITTTPSKDSPSRQIQPTPSDVSSLSAPSVAVNYDEQNDFLSLKETGTSEDVAEDAELPLRKLLWKHFGVRLVGVSVCWLLWDVAFYGNKLFQSSFLLAVAGDDVSLMDFSLAASLNAGVALLGYFGAAVLVDNPSIGRKNLQQWGFFLTGLLFVACGFFYTSLSSATLSVLYMFSSFFGQLGPNATTFVLPAEVFPTQVRTSCHGMAAAAGKAGALLAAIFFPLLHSDLDLFLLSGYASLAASAVTFYTIPETTGLDLLELDRKWRLILAGRRLDYQGAANHPRFLSWYERHKRFLSQSPQQTADMHYNFAMDDF